MIFMPEITSSFPERHNNSEQVKTGWVKCKTSEINIKHPGYDLDEVLFRFSVYAIYNYFIKIVRKWNTVSPVFSSFCLFYIDS